MISPILYMYLPIHTKPYTTHLARSVDISKNFVYRHPPQQALKFHELASELCVGVQRIFLPQKKNNTKKKTSYLII